MLGRTKDAMIVRYKQILRREGNLQNFLKEMEHFHKAECQLSGDDVAGHISQHLVLLCSYLISISFLKWGFGNKIK